MTDSRLYILMRTDLDSMNPGKGMAQAAHASNAFIHTYGDDAGAISWAESTKQGFGTTIVLGVPTEDQLFDIVYTANALRYPSEIVRDPSYPVHDGGVTHYIPVHTCGYVFVSERRNPPLALNALKLHP